MTFHVDIEKEREIAYYVHVVFTGCQIKKYM